jgi:hypothetical protein
MWPMGDLPEFPRELLERRFPGGFTTRDEANAIVAWALRDGPLEHLHAGKHSELLRDHSLSRITDAELEELIRFACERLEELLRLRECDPEMNDAMIKTYNIMYCGHWLR